MRSIVARRAVANWLACLGLGATAPALAQASHRTDQQPASLPKPSGSVILTVNGAITVRNSTDAAVFDAAMIRALPVQELRTRTPWYQEAVTFKGPLLQDLLDAVGARGQSLRIIALNDYAVEVPVEDARQFQPILAYEINGKRLSVRDKGPLFLIYPFDSRPELKNDLYYGRSIWQISSITVR